MGDDEYNMKSLIKPLLVALLVAALCVPLTLWVVPYISLLLIPDSLSGPWVFWLTPLLAGLLAGLLVPRLLPAQRFYVVPMLCLVFMVLIAANWAINRCSPEQLTAIQKLEQHSLRAPSLGTLNNDYVPPPPLDIGQVEGITQEGDFGYSYSCVKPSQSLDLILALHQSYATFILGVLLTLLFTWKYRRPTAISQG